MRPDAPYILSHCRGYWSNYPPGDRLKGAVFESTGHPTLLPGNPRAGSVVMAADPGAKLSCYSVNHGAGRLLGRKRADRELDQATIDRELDEVLRSVTGAGLASEVARLKARFVIKDASKADD